MFNLYELEQFIEFNKQGSLSKAAEALNISSPTLSRSMQNIENEFGVSLFNRTKNKLTLNETGKLAVKEVESFLNYSNTIIQNVKNYDESLKSITIKSCAPVPLWQLLSTIGSLSPSISIRSSINQTIAFNDELVDIYITNHKVDMPDYKLLPYIQEKLYISVPYNHALAHNKSVTFKEINGYDFLLRSETGFWESLCKEHMPDSKFFIQDDEYTISQLIKESNIPNFVSNYTIKDNENSNGRIVIPVCDQNTNVQFYLLIKQSEKLKHLITLLDK